MNRSSTFDRVDSVFYDQGVQGWDNGYLSEFDADSNDPVTFLTDIGEDEICEMDCETFPHGFRR